MFCSCQYKFAKTFPLKSFASVLLLVFFVSCKQIDVYEKTAPFTKHSWPAADKPAFDFTITDTSARYNVFIVLRHTDAYHYNNLWINVTTIPPGDTAQTVRANLKLGDNKDWLGNNIDDIVEHRILINSLPLRLKNGNYKFIIQQIMREDPLPDVLNAGIRVEKTAQ